MAKLKLEQKITKVTEQIAKEEQSIADSKERIKKLNAELKALSAEKERSFASDLIKLMKEKGISEEQFLKQLQSAAVTQTDENIYSSSDTTVTENGNTETTNYSSYK